MRRGQERIRQDSWGTGGSNFETEPSDRRFNFISSENKPTIFLTIATIIFLTSAFIISIIMLLNLRQDRDNLKINDQKQANRIDQLEDQIISLGAEPVPVIEETFNPPVTIIYPSTVETVRREDNIRERQSTTSSSSTTSTSTTTTTTTPPTCVGIVCLKEE